MENEMAAIEQVIKIEVEEVKVEKTEVDPESFGIEQNSSGALFARGHDVRRDRIIGLQRIKDEHNFVEPGSNFQVPEMQGKKIKVEESWEDCIPFEPMYITKEDIFKVEKNDDSIDQNTKIALSSDPEQEVKRQHHVVCKETNYELTSCDICNYTASIKNILIEHMFMKQHRREKSSGTKSFELMCTHCNMKFATKKKLDDHTIRINPDFIETISTKMFECTYCTYKLCLCFHCSATFRSKVTRDDHMVKVHPESIASIPSKIHHCEYCTFKTTIKSALTCHVNKHSKTKLRCEHCWETFKRREGLDEHITRKHPHLIASVSSKIRECPHCTYKTTLTVRLMQHMLKHSDATDKHKHRKCTDRYEYSKCTHCGAEFKHKATLDNHIIREHPDFVGSVSCKFHSCAHCPYKTIYKSSLRTHLLKHNPKTQGSFKLSCCSHCKATFKSKKCLDEHIFKKHAEYTSSVTSKIHRCRYCEYQTILKYNFARHMWEHPETRSMCPLPGAIQTQTSQGTS